LKESENIRRTNGPSPAALPVEKKKSVTSCVSKVSINTKAFNLWSHYCGKKNHNTADCKVIAKFKQQKKACFEDKAGTRKKSLAFLFEEINALKRKLNPENTASIKKSD
jgi:ABC-type histidine transport system ATPase subunit